MKNQCGCGMSPELIRRNKRNIWINLKLIKIFQMLGYKKRIAFHYRCLGESYLLQREYDKAEQTFVKAIEFNQEIDCKELIARNYFNLGNTYLFQGKYDKAEDSFLKAQYFFKESGDDCFSNLMFFNLGSTYMSKGQLDKAEEMYLKYIEVNKKIDSCQVYLALSKVYKGKNDKEKEKDCLKKAIDILKDNGPKELVEKIEKRISDLN